MSLLYGLGVVIYFSTLKLQKSQLFNYIVPRHTNYTYINIHDKVFLCC